MAALALGFALLFAVLTFGVRIALQVRRTGSTGVHGLSGRQGPVEWAAGVGFVLALVALLAAPVLALAGAVEPVAALDGTGAQAAGIALSAAGIAATFFAQVAMGASWRIGVDPEERTALVADGPFAVVRNPIYAAMGPAALGLALLVPSWVALAGLGLLTIALEVQVRAVEEPHLRRVHGAEYVAYAARVGRFAPGVGRLREGGSAA